MASANDTEPSATQQPGWSDRTGEEKKAVTIAEPEAEEISPLMTAKHKELDSSHHFDLDKAARQFRASVSSRRLSGRPSTEKLASYSRSQGLDSNPSLTSLLSDGSDSAASRHSHHENLVKQVSAWLKKEKSRRAVRKQKRKDGGHQADPAAESPSAQSSDHAELSRKKSLSEDSDGETALEQLAHILERTISFKSPEDSSRPRKFSTGRRLSTMMKRNSVISSGEDYFDSIDQIVPSCEAVLDNSKTLGYGAGGPASESVVDLSNPEKCAQREREAWASFKYEIVRLAHTLRLKGWRRVPLDLSAEIHAERLSGALTNCVYVVSPPKDLPNPGQREDSVPVPKNPPPKLLLRIYGPQVEHLIDRESELQILRRLARKRIGPRLLGTFSNGRFEEYFHARPLTPQELRQPEVSKQIAKRMRELHEGIDLLPQEREAGPFVWRNWDKWLDRVERIATWLDQEIKKGPPEEVTCAANKWRQRGFVCGTEWPALRNVIERYRTWLEEQYGGIDRLNERLVFAHNDTQYGNILRLTPDGESPLLLPANEHKQLVVIDFEYSNANLPGLEFANHFSEWSYNYHDPERPYACNTQYYPTTTEQLRFIQSYLLHNPTFRAPAGSSSNPSTPHLGPLSIYPTSSLHASGSSTALTACAAPTSISAFMLDARAPPGEKSSKYDYEEMEAQRERQVQEETRRLMAETRLWRLANSAQWVAWGIVQATVEGMPDFSGDEKKETAGSSSTPHDLPSDIAEDEESDVGLQAAPRPAAPPAQGRTPDEAAAEAEAEEEDEEEEEFDYLGYAQERAMFLWGDAVQMGFVTLEDLPREMRVRVKSVEY